MRFRVTHIMLLICLFIAPRLMQAQQPVTIIGDAPFAANEEIRLLIFDDLLYNIPTVVATDKIDKNGKFKLNYSTNQIKLAQLAIRTTKAEFFVVPNNSYDFHITVDTTLFQLVNPERYGGYLQITTDNTDTNDLNYKINRFSNYFSRAMNYYGFRITYDHDITAYDTLTGLLHSNFDIQYNPLNFYQSYAYYTCGLLDKLCLSKESRQFYQKYFDNDYILYNNPAYMMLFVDNYSGYLYNSKYISKGLLSRTINEEPDYLTLFNETGRDPMLTNERIRELVLILNLIELHDNEEFDAGNTVKLLQYIKASSHFPEHIIYIDNALARFTPNQEIDRSLSLKNSKGKKTSLKQFEGKDIYVQLFQSDCIDCIREMIIMQEFQKRYGEKLHFISISIDPDREQYEKFCKKYEEMFSWPILHFDGNYDWLMENGIETLPEHMIMKSNGQVIDRYIPFPEEGLSDYLQLHYPIEIQQEEDNPFLRNKR